MSNNLTGNPSVGADIGKFTLDQVNPLLLKDISEFINPIVSKAKYPKRSDYMNIS